MVGSLLLRGMLAGLIAGLICFAFLKVAGEASVDQAIAFESATEAAHHDHDHGDDAAEETVSRDTQSGIGLLTGTAIYGASFGGLSHKLISPRARVILLSFIYFYLLLIAGAFGNVVVSTATGLKAAPMAWLFLTIAGILAGQMIYKWRKDIILTTVVTVLIAMAGIYLGTIAPSDQILGKEIATSRPIWAVIAFVFCYFAAVLPIWRFALPIIGLLTWLVNLALGVWSYRRVQVGAAYLLWGGAVVIQGIAGLALFNLMRW